MYYLNHLFNLFAALEIINYFTLSVSQERAEFYTHRLHNGQRLEGLFLRSF